MLGTIVNTIAIVLGSLIGLLLRKGLPENYKDTIMKGISLAVILIGLQNALKTEDIMLVIISMVIGSILGEFLNIEQALENIGHNIENKFSSSESGIAKAFVTSSLLFCVGSMAVVGALQSGLTGNHETLFAKSTLDGIASIIFASSMGIGVIFSAAAVFLYQGLITIAASLLKGLLVDSVITEMSAIGGLLIVALGFNMLEIKKIKVANMLPAIFIPLLYYIFMVVFKF
ncbi:DUF554 domain-containing protein [Clostridium sp. DL1XJH146]